MYRDVMLCRPSPSTSASLMPEGAVMRGNDGRLYESRRNARGVHAWKLSTAREVNFVRYYLHLTPRIKGGSRQDAARLLSTKRAADAVISSMSGYANAQKPPLTLQKVLDAGKNRPVFGLRAHYDHHAKEFVLQFLIARDSIAQARMNSATFTEEIALNYGDLAADTWMEGDMSLDGGASIDSLALRCVSVAY